MDGLELDGKQEKKLMGLNWMQLILAVAISIGTVLSVCSAYITVPQKVDEVRTAQAAFVLETKAAQKAIWDKINDEEKQRQPDHDLLIRILGQVERTQQDVAEIKADNRNTVKVRNSN